MTPRELFLEIADEFYNYHHGSISHSKMKEAVEGLIKARDQEREAAQLGQLEGKQMVIKQLEEREAKLVFLVKKLSECATECLDFYPAANQEIRNKRETYRQLCIEATTILKDLGIE